MKLPSIRATPTRLSGSGFTYIGLLVVVAIIAIIAAGSVQVGAVAQRREAEEQLLAVGLEFKAAIRSYFEATPSGMPSNAPMRLEDLLRDPRYPQVKRHLRKIYDDPLTGKREWGLVRSTEGGVLGVYSTAAGVPIRQDNFPDEFFHFRGKKSYRRWVFVYGVVCTDEGCELPTTDDNKDLVPPPDPSRLPGGQQANPQHNGGQQNASTPSQSSAMKFGGE